MDQLHHQLLEPSAYPEATQAVDFSHGDLHAANICMTDPICIYDCIEFNRRYRVADIIADLAFLLMDLEFRGRRDLAEGRFQSFSGKKLRRDCRQHPCCRL